MDDPAILQTGWYEQDHYGSPEPISAVLLVNYGCGHRIAWRTQNESARWKLANGARDLILRQCPVCMERRAAFRESLRMPPSEKMP